MSWFGRTWYWKRKRSLTQRLKSYSRPAHTQRNASLSTEVTTIEVESVHNAVKNGRFQFFLRYATINQMLPVRQAASRSNLRTSPIPPSHSSCEDLTQSFCDALLGRDNAAKVCSEWLAFPDPSTSKTHLVSYLLKFSETILREAVSLSVRDDALLLFENKAHLSLSVHCNLSKRARNCLQELLQNRSFEAIHLRKPHRIFATRFKYNAVFESAFDRVDVLDCSFHGMLLALRRRRNTLCDVLDGTLNLLLQMPGKWPDLRRVRATIEGFRI